MGGSNKNCLPAQQWRPGDAGLVNNTICLAINKLNNILFDHKYSPTASTKQTNMSSNTFNAKLDSGASKHFF